MRISKLETLRKRDVGGKQYLIMINLDFVFNNKLKLVQISFSSSDMMINLMEKQNPKSVGIKVTHSICNDVGRNLTILEPC